MKPFLNKNVPVLAFHKIDSRFEWGVTRSTPSQFQTILTFLREEGFQTISIAELLRNQPLPEKPIILTFDDAYDNVFDFALPIMNAAGFTATLFVITGYIGSMNTWDVNTGGLLFQHLSMNRIIRLRDQGWEIGSHTVHHPDLTRIAPEYLKKELECSKSLLENALRTPVESIAFPFGRFNPHVLQACSMVLQAL